jgi:hypothetical protein
MGKPDSWQDSYWANFTLRAEMCTPTYYEADMPVTVAIGGASPQISFDESEFAQRRRPIHKDLLDLDRLNLFAFGGPWPKYMPAPQVVIGNGRFAGLEGVTMLLAKAFSLNSTDLMQNQTLPFQASRLRARFFGETILSSVMQADVPSVKNIVGRYTKMETRIVVVSGVGISLAVLLLLAACYLLAMLWYASNRKRPLELHSDPADIAGTVSLVDSASRLAADLRGWRGHSRRNIQEAIGCRVYTLRTGTFDEQKHVPNNSEKPVVSNKKGQSRFRKLISKEPLKHDWRPSMLYKRWLVTLLASLIALTATLLILRKYADKGMLFQSAFVQQVKIDRLHVNLSPHAIISTLVAVLIALCWDCIDKSLRTLQPYLAMSRAPSRPSHGISVSYSSSYWAWAAVKSARSRHWLLCLVTVGTTLTQICKSDSPL